MKYLWYLFLASHFVEVSYPHFLYILIWNLKNNFTDLSNRQQRDDKCNLLAMCGCLNGLLI